MPDTRVYNLYNRIIQKQCEEGKLRPVSVGNIDPKMQSISLQNSELQFTALIFMKNHHTVISVNAEKILHLETSKPIYDFL